MAFTAVYFFQDSTLQARIEFESSRAKSNFAKYVADLVCKFINQKWSVELKPKNSRDFYFICQEYAQKEGLSVSGFMEKACGRMLMVEAKGESVFKKISGFLDLNKDVEKELLPV